MLDTELGFSSQPSAEEEKPSPESSPGRRVLGLSCCCLDSWNGGIAVVAKANGYDTLVAMEPNGLMYHNGLCPLCQQGFLGFWVCDDQKTMIIICDDCEAAYRSPADVASGRATLDRSGHISELGISYLNGRDASRGEIVSLGWGAFIEGEFPYFKNKAGYRVSAEKTEAEWRKSRLRNS